MKERPQQFWALAEETDVLDAFMLMNRGHADAAGPLPQAPQSRCEFSSRQSPLPVMVIDEDIYEQPPSLIIGTVDKFAMLAWNDRSAAIFGLRPARYPAPDLIIQDELHLISGPLGSLVGLYQSVIERLCSAKGISRED